jgi:hypothetical protein
MFCIGIGNRNTEIKTIIGKDYGSDGDVIVVGNYDDESYVMDDDMENVVGGWSSDNESFV